MKAIVKEKKGEGFLKLCDREIPKINSDEVLIKVSYAGICGTDIHIKHDRFPYWPPVIMGHEFSGTVVEVGDSVTDSTRKNLEMRVEAENGATMGKFELAKMAKELGLDAIHDTVREMARDEARHGKAFEGLLQRYFNK